jgi:Protein of unknown function (DUF3307)
MSAPLLTLAWLMLAHLVADFVLQTDRIATDKFGSGRRADRALGAHIAIVALCLVPVVVAWGGPGLLFTIVVVAAHALIDRAKIVRTRHVEAAAIARAHREHEGRSEPGGLGSAWTPVPAALFALDQLAHLAVLGLAWAIWLASAPLTAAWTNVAGTLLGGWDPAIVDRTVLVFVVGLDLLIVNVRAGALFVATLVTPRATVTGHDPHAASSGHGAALGTPRIGETIGVLERLLIVVLVLTGAEVAIGLVIAAKTLARFRQLDDRPFAEYYLLGTLASVSVALGSGLLALAVLR